MRIKVFGIQRTGTNYLSLLIGRNIKPDKGTAVLNDPSENQKEPGWKHGFIPKIDGIDETLRKSANNKAIILIKNPYTWYTSILKWIGPEKATSFDGFLGKTPAHVFKKYNSLYEGHKDFLLGNNKNTTYTDSILIRYEDLVVDAEHELQCVVDKFGVVWKKKFEDIKKVPQSKLFTEAMRKYYIEQKPTYDRNIIKMVTDVVDWDLMSFYGYHSIEEESK